jgi:hypothetical protein
VDRLERGASDAGLCGFSPSATVACPIEFPGDITARAPARRRLRAARVGDAFRSTAWGLVTELAVAEKRPDVRRH